MQLPVTQNETVFATPFAFGRTNKILKAVLDCVLTILALLLFWPLLAIIALLIKLESAGPILHQRPVWGQNGQPFIAYSFRTIYAHQPGQTATAVGQLLRQTGLDELPKLFNVLNQTMSLVGPRFMTHRDLLKYGPRRDIWQATKPGLTGLWLVNGRYLNTLQQNRLDRHYLTHWSLWLDIKILAKTVIIAFGR